MPIKGAKKLGNNINDARIEKKFDIVICSHVLEHVSDLSNLVTKLKKQLKSNGIIYAEVPQEIWAGLRIDADPVTHVNFRYFDSILLLEKASYALPGDEVSAHIPPRHEQN